MRFDAKRAIADAIDLDFPRTPGSDEERRAAAIVAEKLRSAGLEVEIAEASRDIRFGVVESIFSWIAYCVIASLFVVIVLLKSPAGSAVVAISIPCLLLLTDYNIVIFNPLLKRTKTPVVIATPSDRTFRSPIGEKKPKIVFAAKLERVVDDLSMRRVRRPTTIGFVSASLLIRFAPFFRGLSHRPEVAALFVILIILISAIGLRRSLEKIRISRTIDRSNASGLAMLVELARNLTDPRARRLDVRFVVSGGFLGDGSAGIETIGKRLVRERPRSRSLIVELDATGLGPSWTIASSGRFDLADKAAADLRMPIKSTRRSYEIGDLGNNSNPLIDYITLIGGTGVEPSARESNQSVESSPLEAGRLAAAAQLAVEIALRYDKLHTRRSSQAETGGASAQPVAAKSDQNPG